MRGREKEIVREARNKVRRQTGKKEGKKKNRHRPTYTQCDITYHFSVRRVTEIKIW